MSEPTVLLADDEKQLTDLYGVYLDEYYDTRVAYSGEEALEKLDDSVDLMVLDRRMPDYSGEQVLATAREEGWDSPAIFITGVDRDLEEGASADDSLEKPVDSEELVEIVKKHLE